MAGLHISHLREKTLLATRGVGTNDLTHQNTRFDRYDLKNRLNFKLLVWFILYCMAFDAMRAVSKTNSRT